MNPRRILLGAILPVPIYCLGSAVYSFQSLLRHPQDIPTLVVLWFGYGFLIMGIPSLLYSFAMEALRSKESASPAICAVFGAVLGFICGSLFFLFDSQPVVFYTMSLPGALIGGVIPLLLSRIGRSEQVVDGNPH
jgi:membrane associated rhomboid family serine protease